MKYLVAVILTLSLSGCIGMSGLSPEYETAISCRAYASTLRILSNFKNKMTPKQIFTINKAIGVIAPVCISASKGFVGTDNLKDVRDAMTKMMNVHKELK